jgi:RNA polymerase sigma-70 factor (sigma-E family)
MEGLTVGVSTTRERAPDDFERRAAALFNAEAPSLLHLARFYVDDKTAAEDLVQEAFIRLSRTMDRVRDPARGAAYLRSIVINLARDHNRRGLVSLRHRPPDPEHTPSAEELALGRSRRQDVIEALRQLPGRQRDCLTLRFYYDMSPSEIADGLGLSPNSVKTHLRRGLRALALALEEHQKT